MYGAVFASVNIRGGGEFGDEWHLAGTRERKVHSLTTTKNDV
jgi:prolyl oligopeptidase